MADSFYSQYLAARTEAANLLHSAEPKSANELYARSLLVEIDAAYDARLRSKASGEPAEILPGDVSRRAVASVAAIDVYAGFWQRALNK